MANIHYMSNLWSSLACFYTTPSTEARGNSLCLFVGPQWENSLIYALCNLRDGSTPLICIWIFICEKSKSKRHFRETVLYSERIKEKDEQMVDNTPNGLITTQQSQRHRSPDIGTFPFQHSCKITQASCGNFPTWTNQ